MIIKPSEKFVKVIEAATHNTAEELRNTTISKYRQNVESKRGKKTRFKSYFPFIGRGSVFHGEELMSQDRVEHTVSKVLKHF